MTTPKNNIIRQLREQAGLTQVELAQRCAVGQTWISSLENGSPSPASVFRVAAACGLNVMLHGVGDWRITISKKDSSR